jgi:hypothetical protein
MARSFDSSHRPNALRSITSMVTGGTTPTRTSRPAALRKIRVERSSGGAAKDEGLPYARARPPVNHPSPQSQKDVLRAAIALRNGEPLARRPEGHISSLRAMAAAFKHPALSEGSQP